ncbi:hypothetical protein HOD88_02540 [archaeon]|jgi:hypothetical protein|nr:hypothetical protein [archaeon]
MDEEVYQKIISKKEFSDLPRADVEAVYSRFDYSDSVEIEKIKSTRDLLRKMFSAFTSQKILNLKDKDPEWILKKHLSTKERLPYYEEVYQRLLSEYKTLTIFDLGAGINGFSYDYFKKIGINVNYVATEAMGQLVSLMNNYFTKEKISGIAYPLSLFEKEKNVELIKKSKAPSVVFLFKALDSLEMLKRNYSKELLLAITPLVDKVVVSFATKSLVRRSKFKVQRIWLTTFLEENFKILDDFEIGGERYISFKKEI